VNGEGTGRSKKNTKNRAGLRIRPVAHFLKETPGFAGGIKAIGREVTGADGGYERRERDVSYNAIFAGENSGLRPENAYLWNISG
jgi:hypothetical protein